MTDRNQSSRIFSWSTADVPQSRWLGAFVETMGKDLVDVTTLFSDKDNFRYAIKAAQLGALKVVEVEGSAQQFIRTPRDIARSREQSFILAEAIGRFECSRKNSIVDVVPGDLILLDSREEFSVRVNDDFHIRTVNLPIDWMHTWIADPRRLVGQRMSGKLQWGPALASYIAGLTPENAASAPLPPQVMTDQVGALLSLAASEIPGCNPGTAPIYRDQHKRIIDCIRQRWSEPQLTAAEVAASLGMSPRTLHRALAAYGETFGKRLVDTRLEIAVRMLDSRLFDRVTTAEIGRRAGFMDPSHFVRVFRRRLGRTPGAMRQGRDSERKTETTGTIAALASKTH